MATLHPRYNSSRCWQCSSYERGLDEPVPPPEDERRPCIMVGYRKSAYALICVRGNRDKERWGRAQELMLKGTNNNNGVSLPLPLDSRQAVNSVPERPGLDTFSEAVQLCVKYCDPKQHFYVSMKKAGLSQETINDLINKGFVRQYARKPSGYIYRLAGRYHYLVPPN
jgi:hypothetical protein